MSIFGKKFGHFAHKIGRKIHVNDIKKFGTKALHGVDKGLGIAHKVVGGVEKGIKKVSNIAGKLEGVPVLGEFAGMANAGLKQLGSGVKVANKGIKGLEKGVKKVEDLGHTIHKSGSAFKSGNDDRIAGSIKDIAGGIHGMKNPLKR